MTYQRLKQRELSILKYLNVFFWFPHTLSQKCQRVLCTWTSHEIIARTPVLERPLRASMSSASSISSISWLSSSTGGSCSPCSSLVSWRTWITRKSSLSYEKKKSQWNYVKRWNQPSDAMLFFVSYFRCLKVRGWQHCASYAWMSSIEIELILFTINGRGSPFPNFKTGNY